MKNFSGSLHKMKVEAKSPVEYYLQLGEEKIFLNQFIGSRIQCRFTGNIYCIQCQKKTKNSFQQGYCYPCMQRLAECQFCVIHPEKCRVMQGSGCPQDDWAHQQCRQTHIVYIANSSGLKVGITRVSQTPTRWIDQGASQAIPIFQTANRYQSGVIEVALKQFVNDKTDWRKMLKNISEPLGLIQERDRLLEKSQTVLRDLIQGFDKDIQMLSANVVTELNYPVQIYPEKPLQLSLDKSPVVEGKLWGIKGQYLILDTGVFNVRKFAGYEVEVYV